MLTVLHMPWWTSDQYIQCNPETGLKEQMLLNKPKSRTKLSCTRQPVIPLWVCFVAGGLVFITASIFLYHTLYVIQIIVAYRGYRTLFKSHAIATVQQSSFRQPNGPAPYWQVLQNLTHYTPLVFFVEVPGLRATAAFDTTKRHVIGDAYYNIATAETTIRLLGGHVLRTITGTKTPIGPTDLLSPGSRQTVNELSENDKLRGGLNRRARTRRILSGCYIYDYCNGHTHDHSHDDSQDFSSDSDSDSDSDSNDFVGIGGPESHDTDVTQQNDFDVTLNAIGNIASNNRSSRKRGKKGAGDKINVFVVDDSSHDVVLNNFQEWHPTSSLYFSDTQTSKNYSPYNLDTQAISATNQVIDISPYLVWIDDPLLYAPSYLPVQTFYPPGPLVG